MNRIYICIDLKSFYASVECVERGLDPLNTNLVVADPTRTEKTVCLAVSPSLKQYGISGRARLYEVIQKVRSINFDRRKANRYKNFIGKSYIDKDLKENKNLRLDFIIAPPRMKYYMNYSTKIYNIYLKYVSKEDVYVYSIDEVFIDITTYLKYYKLTPRELITKIIKDIYDTTGITATGGIGTNLFLCKVAMDVVAKHTTPNEYGVRIAELDEMTYRKILWNHKPITDIWRVGRGTAEKLAKYNMYTMGDVARCSINNEDLLYKLFGVNAEILIDHSWGYEPCTMEYIKSYKPTTNSICSGQVLHCPYNYNDTKLIIREMADLLSLDLVNNEFVTSQLTLTITYDVENMKEPYREFVSETTTDFYGRVIPKYSHGTINLDHKTSSSTIITNAYITLFERITNSKLLIRKINMSACNLTNCYLEESRVRYEQFDIFSVKDASINKEKEIEQEKKERKVQKAILDIKNKYGKNAILKGMNLEEKATTIDRNKQIGGHSE